MVKIEEFKYFGKKSINRKKLNSWLELVYQKSEKMSKSFLRDVNKIAW